MRLRTQLEEVPLGTNILNIEVPDQLRKKILTGLTYWDDSLGGQGFTPSAVTLFVGTPGAGKTTMMLELANALTRNGALVLFNTAEESLYQLKMTVDRLGLQKGFVAGQETTVPTLLDNCDKLRLAAPKKPFFLIVDSLQTLNDGKYGDNTNSKTAERSLAMITNWCKENYTNAIVIGQVTKEVAEGIGLAKPQGALVSSVERDSPAEKAGVEAGDVILRFDGKPIETSVELPRVVGATKPGTKSTMQVWRKGKTIDLQVTVAETQADRQPTRRGEPPAKPQNGGPNALGLTVSDVPAERLKELRLRAAVQVDAVEGAAAAAGLRQGDLIVAVNNVEVQNTKQFNDFVGKLDPKKPATLLIRRGDQSTFVIVRPAEK